MNKKRVCIIGSGVAGSGIAALLAHSGKYQVDLYERNKKVGGRFSAYSPRKGYNLDIGIHGITQTHIGKIGQLLNRIEAQDLVEWNVFDKPVTLFKKGVGWANYPEHIGKLGFSDDDLTQIIDFMGNTLAIPVDKVDDYNHISLREQIDKYIRDERAQNLFAFMAALAFVIPSQDVPVGEWSIAERGIQEHRAVGYPLGGTGAIPEAFVSVLKDKGGRLITGKTIKRVMVESKTAVGVEFKDGSTKEYDIIISNAGSKEDIHLVGKEQYDNQEYIQKMDSMEYSRTIYSVRVGLDKTVIDREKDIVMYLGSEDELTEMFERASIHEGVYEEVPEVMPALMIPILSNMDPGACPAGKQTLTMGCWCSDPLDTPRERLNLWKEACLKTLETIWPGINEHIEWVDTTTPAQYARMFGENGNVIGIAQKIGQVGKDRPPIIDPEIENLYHCSADTGLHGVGGELASDSAMRLFEILER